MQFDSKSCFDSVIRTVLLGDMEESTTICSLQMAGAGSTGRVDDGGSPKPQKYGNASVVESSKIKSEDAMLHELFPTRVAPALLPTLSSGSWAGLCVTWSTTSTTDSNLRRTGSRSCRCMVLSRVLSVFQSMAR